MEAWKHSAVPALVRTKVRMLDLEPVFDRDLQPLTRAELSSFDWENRVSTVLGRALIRVLSLLLRVWLFCVYILRLLHHALLLLAFRLLLLLVCLCVLLMLLLLVLV